MLDAAETIVGFTSGRDRAALDERLIHGYFDIDTGIVWKTVSVEIPSLVPKLKALASARPRAEEP